MEKEILGKSRDGKAIEAFVLRNNGGVEVRILSYGGRISHLRVPDRHGKSENIVLGFDHWENYLQKNPYFGAIVGRYANRIAKGRFQLDGQAYELERNNGENHLHGGLCGFDSKVWTAQAEPQTNSLVLEYVSPDGEEGYPGKLRVEVRYTLTQEDELEVHYKASCDRKTVLNLTQHSYFNLSGDFSKDILDHELQLEADTFLPVTPEMIPTGALEPVAGTAFDFRSWKTLGADIGNREQQLLLANGYDHCLIIRGTGMRRAAQLRHPKSGRGLEVLTTEPGMQLYSANWLDGSLPRGDGGFYQRRSGLCLETQHFPDSPNQPQFPSVVLEPGELFTSTTVFRFLRF